MTIELVTGWTAPVAIALLSKGAIPEGTMAGMTAVLVLRDTDGALVNTTGDMTITDSTNWIVSYTPDPTDLIPGVYFGRIKVTDGSGGVAYFPSGEFDTWTVLEESELTAP